MDTKRSHGLDLSVLAAAPHRLLFFIGAANVLAAMGWWSGWLGGWLSSPSVPAGWMHAFVMQYQVLPTFIFGFLLTVFPRWMAQTEASRWHYLPVGLGLVAGQALVLAGLVTGSAMLVHLGVVNTLAGWIAAMVVLGGWLARDRSGNWHAISCFGGLLMGLAGLLAFVAYLHVPGEPRLVFAMLKIGTFGLLVPVYATVAHRMFPFFAGNVVAGYVPWRPMWLLAVSWPLWLGHLALELAHLYPWLWLVDLPLLALAALTLWKWWPRGKAPALLRVLFLGYAWLPVALALYSAQSLWFLGTGEFTLGRAPVHAVSVGFFGSLLVAMVTRVTQGHSGRPLVLGRIPALAFAGMQGVAVLRVGAELAANPAPWFLAASLGWLLVFLPWVLRSLWIYATPRIDGRPG
ncbi:MAG TPA: NnrS family protein [Arenimonas sp.]|uniref:NnrS family protein n=1 Tax=Arenimonas sp. TaxID=1872635 RepID=UPI002D80F1D7|nr:NnrS family protein [Arenimonas sp.]HEU0153070.1 NnrS family protein [Arenimonas sp.]